MSRRPFPSSRDKQGGTSWAPGLLWGTIGGNNQQPTTHGSLSNTPLGRWPGEFAWEGSRNKYLTYFAIPCTPPRIRVLRDLGLQAVRAILHELPKVLGLLDALGTLLLDCRCILEPSKAFAGLPSEAFEGLWRPSKAFPGL